MADSGDEDDYMSMTFADPASQQNETSIQRVARRKREAALRAQVKSKAEKTKQEAAAREAALATPVLDSSNKGYKMMAKLGFKHGDTLGANQHGCAEPIQVVLKEDKGGIGLDTERKRKFREQMDHEAKRVQVDDGEYRARVRFEREELKREGQIRNAQKVAQELALRAKDDQQRSNPISPSEYKDEKPRLHATNEPLGKINLLWRGLVRQRLEIERGKRMRSLLPTYQEPDLDYEDLLGLGRDEKTGMFEEEVEEEDAELDHFNALPSGERLERLVSHMRQEHRYCFWCKYQYPDESMSGCPGITEDDHD